MLILILVLSKHHMLSIQGRPGKAGAKGEIGLPGLPGPKGDMGANGNKGPKGVKGAVGQDGPQGPKGISGNRVSFKTNVSCS